MSRTRDLVLGLCFAGLQVFGQASAPLLKAGPGGHHLVDENGKPFPLRGEAAWSLAVQLTREEAAAYFADRQAKGFNAVKVEEAKAGSLPHRPRERTRYGTMAAFSADVMP